MNKKGISPLLAAVLIIGVSVALVVGIMFLGQGFIEGLQEQSVEDDWISFEQIEDESEVLFLASPIQGPITDTWNIQVDCVSYPDSLFLELNYGDEVFGVTYREFCDLMRDEVLMLRGVFVYKNLTLDVGDKVAAWQYNERWYP